MRSGQVSGKIDLMNWNPRKSFYVLLTLLGLGTLYVVWGYLGLLFLALILVIVFEPAYDWLLVRVKRGGIAGILTTVMILMVMIVPLAVLVGLAVQQARGLVILITSQLVVKQVSQSKVLELLDTLQPGLVYQIEQVLAGQQSQLVNIAQSVTQSLGQIVTKGVIPAVATTAKTVIDMVIFVVMLAYLFPAKKKLFAKLKALSPLNDKQHDQFIRRFEVVIRATVKGMLFVGLAQGLAGALMLTILQVPGAALWGLMMGIAAFIPFGSGLVWWPIGIVLILSGQWIQGIIWILYGLLVISTLDNIVRSKVLGAGESALPELITFVAVLGGLQAFGFIGFIIGPLIVALFLTAMELYLEGD